MKLAEIRQLRQLIEMRETTALARHSALVARQNDIAKKIEELARSGHGSAASADLTLAQAQENWMRWRGQKIDELSVKLTALQMDTKIAKSDAQKAVGKSQAVAALITDLEDRRMQARARRSGN